MEKINKEKRQYIKFLSWLEQRLIYKHSYDRNDDIIVSIQKLINFLQPKLYLNIMLISPWMVLTILVLDIQNLRENDLGLM
jgi:hypothetical protein